MLGEHGSIIMPPGTPYAEEMRKHEAYPTKYGAGQRPYVYREYPKRVYKASRKDQAAGIEFEGFTVNTDDELRNLQSRGYHETQQAALAALEAEQTEHGKLAAERNWEAKHGRLSEKAVAEMRAAEAEHGARHLPMVPETPIVKRRTRGPNKPKVAAPESV